MAAEEKKLAKMASKIKISDSPAQPKATFLRKSALLTTGDNSFKFNFNVPQENNDSEVVSNVNDKKQSTSQESLDESSKSNAVTPNVKPIKFANSTSEFKFNFNIDK